MLISDVMTRNVISIPSSMPIVEVRKLFEANRVTRVPVVDKGKLVGLMTRQRLDRVLPTKATSLSVWEINYLLAKITVGEVMVKDVLTVSPTASIEQGVAAAEKAKVGGAVVVDNKGNVVGMVTTTDFFKAIIDKLLGEGKPGVRLTVKNIGPAMALSMILGVIGGLGIRVETLFTIQPGIEKRQDLIIHLDTNDAQIVIKALKEAGFEAEVRPR